MKRLTFFAIVAMFISINAFSQETIRYVPTKYYDQDYVPQKPNTSWGDGTLELTFHGNTEISYYAGGFTNHYKYSHDENGNRVYYMITNDLVTGELVFVKTSVFLVSYDRNLINQIQYEFNGKHYCTTVYERKAADRPRQMLR